jgi:Putative metallopeptidase
MRSPTNSICRRWAAPDAADSFATIALLDAGSEFSINVLVQAARGLFLSDRRDRRQREELDFSEAHGLDKQRAYQIICLMVGSDQEQFKELADWVRMPRDRQRTCANDYEDAKYAWHSLLEPHRHADGKPNASIEIAYEAGQANLGRYARSFQSVELLEALSDYASSRYTLPRPTKMAMASCGDANAAWVSSANTETLCYELADDFSDLYDGYTTNCKVQDQGLISKNVARISLAHNRHARQGRDGDERCRQRPIHEEDQARLRQHKAASGKVSAKQRRSRSCFSSPA